MGKIYYTLDASSPLDSLSRVLYTNPILISGPTQRNLKAVAIDYTGRATDVRTDICSFTMTVPIVTPPSTILAANVQVVANNIPTVTSWSTQTFGGRTINNHLIVTGKQIGRAHV